MDSEPVAAAPQPEKQVEEMLQNLKMNAAPKQSDATEASAKEGSSSEGTSSVTSLGDAASIKDGDVEQEVIAEQGLYYPPNNYYGLYYPGYEAPGSEWDEHGCFMGTDGLEIQYSGFQTENGSVVYYMPGYGYHQPVYNPYNPYIPGALIGVDGQYVGHQPYYPGPVYPQSVSSPGYFQPPVQYGADVVPAYSWESVPLLVDRANGNGLNGSTTGGSPRLGYSVAAVPHIPYSKGMIPVGKASASALDSKVSVQASEGLQLPSVSMGQATSQGNIPSTGFQTQGVRPFSKIPQQGLPVQAPVLPKGYVPLGKLAASSNQGKTSMLYSSNNTDFKPNGRGWVGGDRLKLRGKVNGNGNLDVLTEQNRGPRINRIRNPWVSPGEAGAGSQGVVRINEGCSPAVNRDQYNLADFSTKYDNALFFVIKSYSEDDVHKSIKYNVWASTPNGNKRLDAAYQIAQERSGGKPGSCPVFLFFSVNASGQFCGVAEMSGPVDFNKSMTFWQQDKWSGFFPVKWHMIKDIPNSQFRHIILENNDNKPVTNSRDTQEIKYAQGMEMLNIFKNFSLRTSILDDFMFYEGRQKTMQDKKTRPSIQQQEHLQIAVEVDASVQHKRLDEDVKVNTPLDLSSTVSCLNGSQPSDSSVRKKTVLGSSSVKKDENIPSKVVDSKKNELKGTGGELPSVLKSGPVPS